jgi:hypothetical protein
MLRLTRTYLLLTVLAVSPALANEYSWSPQLTTIGVSQNLQTIANDGQGFTIAIVDTGISNHSEFAGRISGASACAAVTFGCGNGVADDHGHGSHVAGIAAAARNSKGMVGVAPKATIAAFKVLNANGSGYDSDVANGIRMAANSGAGVINLSLTYIPTASIVSAMNYAASKGSIIVFAGGNSGSNLLNNANTLGLTAAAINRLVFVGALGSNNQIAYFSNKPGSGSALYSGKKGSTYKSLWLMAPGTNILSVYAPLDNYYTWMSGTSMAAPVVSGSIALLGSRWPVLLRDGTLTQVLFSSAQDMGAKGADNVYGNGLLRLDKAFQPIGGLSVALANGKQTTVTSVTGGMVTSGALGSLSSVSSKLRNYTVFDTFKRDFYADLSKMLSLTKKQKLSVVNSTAARPKIGATKFADGSSFAFGSMEVQGDGVSHPTGMTGSSSWFISFTDAGGTTMAAGYGFPGALSFSDAMWGSGSASAEAISELGVSNALYGLTGGGSFAAYGTRIGQSSRLAFSWSQTAPYDTFGGQNWATPEAQALGLGLSTEVTPNWKLGFTVSSLNEKHGLLGSQASGALSLGDEHKSFSFGASSAYAFDAKSHLVIDAAVVNTDGAAIAGSIFSKVSTLRSLSYGAAFTRQDLMGPDDRLTLSLRMPLRVYSGSAMMATTSVDSNGYPITTQQRIDLTPSGSETDFSISYQAPLDGNVSWNASLDYRHNADHVAGVSDKALRIGTKWAF